MTDILTPIELRVIGSLIEKEITTPDYHPLTLNALVAACNQKSNRDPVMSLSSDQVQATLDDLRRRRLAVQEMIQAERVPKYRQSWTSVAGLTPDEKAVMAELILRGPQTLGELRGRCARMHEFDDLGQVQLTLDGLMEREAGALVMLLPRQPGNKERRYAHLLGGEADVELRIKNEELRSQSSEFRSQKEDRTLTSEPVRGRDEMESLRREITELRDEIADLRQQFREFKKQFE